MAYQDTTQDEENSSAAALDAAVLAELSGLIGNRALLRIIESYLRHTPDTIAEMRRASRQDQAAEQIRRIQRLVSNSRFIGALGLAGLLERLESGSAADAALFDRIEASFDQLALALHEASESLSRSTEGTADQSDKPSELGDSRVLIVDGDPVRRTMLMASLETSGLAPHEAVDGQTALTCIYQVLPDLIVLNAQLSQFDAAELCRRLRRDPATAHIPLLIVDECARPEAIQRAFEAGATDVLTWPLNLMLFGYRVRHLLRASHAERALRDMVEVAQAANAAKSQFLANMSHELRTPLNAVIGFSEIIGTYDPEKITPERLLSFLSYAQDIHASALHLLKVINDILDLSMIESGNMKIDIESVDLQETLEEVERFVRCRAAEAKVQLRLAVSPDLPIIRTDRRRLQQVMLNLLSNSIKFTPGGGVANIEAKAGADGSIIINTRDNGMGIPEQMIETALSPFGQVDSGLNRRYEGTGLGLPLAKSITERLGGSLSLQSRCKEGTVVTLTFPPEAVSPSRECAA